VADDERDDAAPGAEVGGRPDPAPAPRPARGDDGHAWWTWPWRQVGRVLAGAAGLLAGNWRRIVTFVLGVLVGVGLSTFAARGLPFTGDDDQDLAGDRLVVLSGTDDSPNRERDRLIQTWNRLHPDMQAEIQPLSSNADKAYEEMVRRAQSAEPDVDVYNLDVVWMATFADSGWIRPLTDDVDTAGFLEKPLDTCRYRGELWGLPFNTDAGLLYFRPGELVARGVDEDDADLVANPPRSWNTLSTLIDTAFRGTRQAGDRLAAGYTGQFKQDYEGFTVNVMEAIWAKEGDVVDAEGEVRLDSPAAKEALQELGEAYRSSRDVLPGSRGFEEGESRDAFDRGSVLFMRNWPLAYRQLTAQADEAAAGAAPGPAATDIRVTRLPGPSALGGQNLAVSSSSEHPDAARQLVEFLTSETSQQILFQDGGYAATRQRIYDDPYIRRNYDYADTLLAAVKDARLRPVTPHYVTFSEKFRVIAGQILTTGRDVRPADVALLSRALEGKAE
jgi:multiple sugar transport system substrate-binding protein